jgi:hypothetical protein
VHRRILLPIVLLLLPVRSALSLAHSRSGRVYCRGEYSTVHDGVGNAKLTPFDQWEMYAVADGTFVVETSMVFPTISAQGPKKSIKQRLTYDRHMSPVSFGLEDSISDASSSRPLEIECRYRPTKLQCSSRAKSGDARPLTETLDQREPYVFLPYPLLNFDLPWFYRDLASRGDHVKGKQILVPILCFEDNGESSGDGVKVQEIDVVEYLGEEAIRVGSKSLAARKFRTWESATGAETHEDIWLSDSGLVLQLSQNGKVDFVLSKYSGPPL